METLAVVGASRHVLSAYTATPLTGQERERAAGFRFARDRDDFVAAHLLVRACAGEVLGQPPGELTVAQRCPVCAGGHGPPRLVEAPGIGVSLAHTRGYVAACAGRPPVGVDVEVLAGRGSAVRFEVLAGPEARWVRSCQDPDRAFLELWVRKEALVKAGYATLDTLRAVDLIGDGAEPAPRWRGLWLTGFGDDRIVGACATADEVRVRRSGR